MKRVVVVGGGIVGLSVAWFIRQQGAEVTVVDRKKVGSGASWGNAGWVSPAFSVPLAEPSALKLGLRAFLSPTSPVAVPVRADPNLLRFLVQFARNCRADTWEAGLRALTPLNLQALSAYRDMMEGGVEGGPRRMDPGLIFVPNAQDLGHLEHELKAVEEAGQKVDFDVLGIETARRLAPMVSADLGAAMRLNDQQFLDPRVFVSSLATKLREHGVSIVEDTTVEGIEHQGTPMVQTSSGTLTADSVVVANGAWLADFGKKLGIRQPVQAGRGYSFSVRTATMPTGPLYFPAHRVVATPMGDTLRVSGMMEFHHPDAPLNKRRLQAIVRTIEPLLPSIDFDSRSEEWVGSRPCTADGLPLIGRTRIPDIHVAGGYGMWGMTLGPAGGKLLASQILGTEEPALAAFNPLR